MQTQISQLYTVHHTDSHVIVPPDRRAPDNVCVSINVVSWLIIIMEVWSLVEGSVPPDTQSLLA